MNRRHDTPTSSTTHERQNAGRTTTPAAGRRRAAVTLDLSAVLAEVFATAEAYSPAEHARRLAHVLMTGELPRTFQWSRCR